MEELDADDEERCVHHTEEDGVVHSVVQHPTKKDPQRRQREQHEQEGSVINGGLAPQSISAGIDSGILWILICRVSFLRASSRCS